jgi:hypothetical protein
MAFPLQSFPTLNQTITPNNSMQFFFKKKQKTPKQLYGDRLNLKHILLSKEPKP